MSLYFKYMKLHFKKMLQYKMSFIFSFISQLFIFFTYYFTIIALFNKFSNVNGFSVYEVLLTFSIIQFGYSINEVFARGIDNFDKLINKGEFDRILLRPKNVLLQVLGYEIGFAKTCKVLQAITILIISILKIDIIWSFDKILTLTLMLISSCLLFFGIFLLSASYCFVTIEGLECRNIITDGGKHMSQYPIGIFNRGFRFIFTFIIPYGFVNYYPLLYLLGRVDNVIFVFSPLIVIVFLIPCFLTFNILSKKYKSAGS